MKDIMKYTIINSSVQDGDKKAKSLLDDQLNFLIDTNYIAMIDDGKSDTNCRKQLASYLTAKGIPWKRIEDVWEDICSLPRPAAFELDEILLNKLENNWSFKHKRNSYEFDFNSGTCINLCEDFTLNREEYIDRDFFDYFFAFRLSKRNLGRIRDFLGFNLTVHFNSDIREFKAFLENVVILKHGTLIGETNLVVLQNILKIGEDSEIAESAIGETEQQTSESKYFQEAFRTREGYQYIIKELAKTERGTWFDANGNFIRKGRGNGQDNPSAVGTLLVLLIEREYLKEKFLWNNETKRNFIIKAFNVKIGSLSTSLKTKPKQLELLNFIKYHKYLLPRR